MYSLVWGKAQQLCFADDHEYYRVLGSLCRNDSYTITFETNSETESWGDAFRIKCLRPDSQTPYAFIDAMRTARRINCNDYVQNLYEYHDFDFDVGNKVLIGNYDKVKRTVPTSYHYDFDEGYNLRFTRYGKSKQEKKKNAINSNTLRDITKRAVKTEVKTEPVSVIQKAPKPEPVPVSVGETIMHKSFGHGRIISNDGKYIKVHFDAVGEKTFANPGAFEGGFIRKGLRGFVIER